MIILSHRGYWLAPAERNKQIAFDRSFQLSFGTETDIRDSAGSLVISHDVPSGDEFSFEEFLRLYNKYGSRHLPLALNVKSDGLAQLVKVALSRTPEVDAFVFDMAVPDMPAYFEAQIPVFARMSEVEQRPVWLDQCEGIWLDSFGPTWYDGNLVADLLSTGKRVCVVSCELHKRDPASLWKTLVPHANHPNLLLCTDLPEDAQTFFNCR